MRRRLLSLKRYGWSWVSGDLSDRKVAYFKTRLYEKVPGLKPAPVIIDSRNADDIDWLNNLRERYARHGVNVEVMDPDEHGFVELRIYYRDAAGILAPKFKEEVAA